MSYPKACCSTPTIVSYYKPTGSTLNISSIPVYSVGPAVSLPGLMPFFVCSTHTNCVIRHLQAAAKALLIFYDIFGSQ